jgi:hypothetical protein
LSNVKKSIKIKKQYIVGHKKLLDQETGELVDAEVIIKNIEQDHNFFKVWLMDMLGILNIVGNKKIQVIDYLLRNLRREDNTISLTYREVAKKTGVSLGIVVETFKILQETNFLKKVKNGLYMVNPDILVKGRTGKRVNLLIQYHLGKESLEEKGNREK